MPISALPQALSGLPISARELPSAANSNLSGPIELMGARMTFARNAEIYGEGEPADYLYKVVSGAVRTCKATADGRRQIGGFYLPGDLFGLEGGSTHVFSAEAIADRLEDRRKDRLRTAFAPMPPMPPIPPMPGVKGEWDMQLGKRKMKVRIEGGSDDEGR